MNRHEKAKAAFRRLIGKMDDVDYEHEFQVIVQEVEYSQKLVAQQSRSEWRAVFKWRNFRRVLIPVLPYAGQSLNGGAYISSYTVSEKSGPARADADPPIQDVLLPASGTVQRLSRQCYHLHPGLVRYRLRYAVV